MTFKLAAGFAIPWAFMAILASIMALSASPPAGSGDAYTDLTNSFLNPAKVSIDQPEVGESDNAIGGLFDAVTFAKDWLVFMARAAILDYPFWQGDLVIIRYFLLALASPFMFIVAKEFVSAFGNLIGGVFGAVTGGRAG